MKFVLPGFLLTLFLIPACADQPEGRLNLLIIMTDQQRFDALSAAGNTVLQTPNIDRIADGGVLF